MQKAPGSGVNVPDRQQTSGSKQQFALQGELVTVSLRDQVCPEILCLVQVVPDKRQVGRWLQLPMDALGARQKRASRSDAARSIALSNRRSETSCETTS
jgi:hypothetical protein